MEKQIKGIDRINARILAEAEEYAAAEKQKAQAQADEMLASARKKAEEKAAAILSKAKESAAAAVENAKSGAGMKERNSLLSLKVEMAGKAFDAALAKLAHLPKEEYIRAMSALLVSAVNGGLADGDNASLAMNEKDAEFAEAILAAASPAFTKKVTVTKARETVDVEAGFLLICGDIEINCSAKTVVEAARDTLEKPVLDILFGE